MAHRIKDVVDGTRTKPGIVAGHEEEIATWTSDDAKARFLIVTTLEEEQK